MISLFRAEGNALDHLWLKSSGIVEAEESAEANEAKNE